MNRPPCVCNWWSDFSVNCIAFAYWYKLDYVQGLATYQDKNDKNKNNDNGNHNNNKKKKNNKKKNQQQQQQQHQQETQK